MWESQFPETYAFEFLKENEQILKLRFSQPVPTSLIENKPLPYLSCSFMNLKSLSLISQEKTKTIDEYSLHMISKLKGLEQIYLNAGIQRGTRYNWRIDHDLMRKYLARLPVLRKIAFSRDSYENRNHIDSIDDYYQLRIPDAEDQAWWEETHRKRMVSETFKYVKLMPSLEWMYFG